MSESSKTKNKNKQALSKADVHKSLHPHGGLPPRVVAFLLEAFAGKAEGRPVAVRSKEFRHNSNTYQCSVSTDGQKVAVNVIPLPGLRNTLMAKIATEGDAEKGIVQRLENFKAVLQAHKDGKRNMADVHVETLKAQVKDLKEELKAVQGANGNAKKRLQEIPNMYTLTYDFDTWKADEYRIVACGAEKLEMEDAK